MGFQMHRSPSGRLTRVGSPCARRRPEMAVVGFAALLLLVLLPLLSSHLETINATGQSLALRARSVLEVASLMTGAAAPSAKPPPNHMDYFVRVNEGRFVVGPECQPFFISGWNWWEAMEASAGVLQTYGASLPENTTGPALIRGMLDKAQRYGFNLVRTWAHPVTPAYALMSAPGEYNEEMFRGLDYLLSEARQRGVRVLLAITDNWQATGGADSFRRWAGGEYHEDFFRLPEAKQLYKDHVRVLLNRVNTVTGVAYKDDPTIFGYNLLNEGRCFECGDLLATWIEEMAAFVKSIDAHHLLTVGEEGFYGAGTERAKFNPEGSKGDSWANTEGQNFPLDHASPHIDFTSIHLWLSNWEDVSEEFARDWLQVHMEDARRLNKPLLLEEFGEWGVGKWKKERDGWYKFIYDTIAEDAAAGGPSMGALFWQWYENGQVAPAEEGGGPGGMFGIFDTEPTWDIVMEFTQAMNNLTMNAPPFTGTCDPGVSAPMPADCSHTNMEGQPSTGFEGGNCDVDINECARGLAACHARAACANTAGGYACTCYGGYTGDGFECEPNQQLKVVEQAYATAGAGRVACQEGQDIEYPTSAPGWAYDVTTAPTRHESSPRAGVFGARARVEPLDCMIACSSAVGCDSFSYNSHQKRCFLKSGASRQVCVKPETLCVSVRGTTYSCGGWQTYYNATAVYGQPRVEAFEGPGLSALSKAMAEKRKKRLDELGAQQQQQQQQPPEEMHTSS